MEKKKKVLLTFIAIILLISGIYLFTDWFSKVTGYLSGEDEKTKLATCLAESGSEFYSDLYCADCEKQKEMFGKSFSIIPTIECNKKEGQCPNIKSLPAWYINKTIVYGYKNFSELKALSSCN